MFSRSIRIIFLASLIFVIGANYVFFATAQDVFNNNDWVSLHFISMHNQSTYEYRGFKYFFEYMKTFPGLANSHNTVSTIAGIINNQVSYTNNDVLNVLLNILTIISSPVQLIICLVVDIFNNLVWLFTFFIPNFV